MIPQRALISICALGTFLNVCPVAFAAEGAEGTTAVASRVSTDYVRRKLPDGSFEPEAYAFGKGGNWGSPVGDEAFDRLGFLDVARVIPVSLAERNYVPAKDPEKTRLLILVYWGTTDVPEPTNESSAYQT